MKGLVEWYWTIRIAVRSLHMNRARWFEGVPRWYIEELAAEDCRGEADDLRAICYQARKEYAK